VSLILELLADGALITQVMKAIDVSWILTKENQRRTRKNKTSGEIKLIRRTNLKCLRIEIDKLINLFSKFSKRRCPFLS
jgi:hypothetical protein